jgi:hypothetical protein
MAIACPTPRPSKAGAQEPSPGEGERPVSLRPGADPLAIEGHPGTTSREAQPLALIPGPSPAGGKGASVILALPAMTSTPQSLPNV